MADISLNTLNTTPQPLGNAGLGDIELSPVGNNVSIQGVSGGVPVTFASAEELSSTSFQSVISLPKADTQELSESLNNGVTSREGLTLVHSDALDDIIEDSTLPNDDSRVFEQLLRDSESSTLSPNDKARLVIAEYANEDNLEPLSDVGFEKKDERLERTKVSDLKTQVEFLRDYEQASYNAIKATAGDAALALVQKEIQTAFQGAVDELETVSKDSDTDLKTKNKTIKKLLTNGKPKGYKLLARIKQKIAVREFEKAGLKGKPLPKFNKDAGLTLAVAAYTKGRLKAEAKVSTDPSLQQRSQETSVKSLFKSIKSEFTQVLSKNTERWQPFQRDIDLEGGVVAKVGYTPARHLSSALADSYGDVQGSSSLDRVQTEHTSNAVKTEVEIEGTPFKFEGLRHGVHDAFGAAKKTADGQPVSLDVQTKRARESVQILATSVPDRLQQSSSVAQQFGDTTFELPIVSINLETPELADKGRGRVNNQLAAFKHLEGKPIPVEIPGRPDITHVVPKFVALNSPVAKNAGYVGNALNGLKNAHQTNEKGLALLVGKPGKEGYSSNFTPDAGSLIGQKLIELKAEPEKNAAKIALIEDLTSQVVQSFSAKSGSPDSYRNIGNQPYEFSVRLAALANEADLGVCFNCKSGKDRTGQLDTRIKDFYADFGRQYLKNEKEGVKDPAAVKPRPLSFERDSTDVAQLQRLHEQGGSRDNQIANTGLPGTKGGYDEVYREFGYHQGDFDPLVGLSKFSVS